MECNKEEAEKCIAIGRKALASGDHERALKFFKKSLQLYHTKEAEDLIKTAQQQPKSHQNSTPHTEKETSPPLRRRKHAHHSEPQPQQPAASVTYTQEQVECVTRVLKAKSYYEVLGVTKDVTEVHLKKAYRKSALKLHPDKNTAPGAEEAFKAVTKAYACLSDSGKRGVYDATGRDADHPPTPSPGYRGSHFQGEMSAEDFFEMFFNMPQHQTGRTYRYYTMPRRRPRQQQQQQSNEGMPYLSFLFPLLLLTLLAFFSSSVHKDAPLFQFEQSKEYPIQRQTANHGFNYFVNNEYSKLSPKERETVEDMVEHRMIRMLRESCLAEKQHLMKLRNRGWSLFRSAQQKERDEREAREFVLRSCNQLSEMGYAF